MTMLQIQIIGDYSNSISFILESKFWMIPKQEIINAFNELYVWQKSVERLQIAQAQQRLNLHL